MKSPKTVSRSYLRLVNNTKIYVALLCALWLMCNSAFAQRPPTPNFLPSGISLGPIERVSLAPDGSELNAPAFQPTLSGDGRFLLYTSLASNILPGMPDPPVPADPAAVNNCNSPVLYQWYVLDRQTRQVERVSVNNQGQPAASRPLPSGCSLFSRPQGNISRDGRYVFYNTIADNLGATDTNQGNDSYRFDRQTKQVQKLYSAPSGRRLTYVTYSADGEVFIVLCDGAGLATVSLCVRDMRTNTIAPILAIDGQPTIGEDFANLRFGLNFDGSVVVYLSSSPRLVPGGGNGQIQAVRWNRQTGERRIISIRQDGALSDGVDSSNFGQGPHFFAVNDDARVVAFPIRDGGAANVGYNSVGAVWREATGKMESVSHNTEIEPRVSFGFPSMSGDGDLLIFFSVFGGFDQFNNFLGSRQIWLRRNRGEGPAGRLIRNLQSYHPSLGQGEDLRAENHPAFLSWGMHGFNARRGVISGDGKTVAFTSYAPDLVVNDLLPINELTQQGVDIFVARVIDTEKIIVVEAPIGNNWLWGALALLVLLVGIRFRD